MSWVPFLIFLILYFQLLEVQVQTFFFSCCFSEMQVHLSIEASLKTFLLFKHVVIEIRIKVRNRFMSKLELIHAVIKDNSLCTLLILSLLHDVDALNPHSCDSHRFFRRSSLSCYYCSLQWLRQRHLFIFINYNNSF